MGFKRPFDDEKFQELPLKHSRQLGYNDKSVQFDEVGPRYAVSQKPVAIVNEGNFCKSQVGESSDGDMFGEDPNFVHLAHDTDGTFTSVTKACGGSRSPHSVNCFELGLAQRLLAPVETAYSFLLNQPAIKQVPIGPGHQAIIPEWAGNQNGNVEPSGMTFENHIIECADSEKLSGTCLVAIPAFDTVAQMDELVGEGRKFCVCDDRGSIRCVRQHIKEAREEIVKMFGYETFKDLGFCYMGEEVAQSWSDEDARLFHEIVYSNPVTLGRNFWKDLEAAFCSLTKKEIVSYYFNVFVLRRRATQNRTYLLDIDSDDDEWHGCYRGSSGTHYAEEDEEDSAIESPLHQGTEKVYPLYQGEGEKDDDACDDTSEGGTGLFEEHKMNSTVEYVDRFSESNGKRLNVEDDSCTSFELAHEVLNSGWTNCAKKDESCLAEQQKKLRECNDAMDTKVCDASRCPNVSTNVKGLQPARSIMNEILCHGSYKARN